MKEKSLYWIIGLLVSFSGAVLPGSVTVAPSGGTTSAHASSAYIIGIKIINRIYNDSLTDQQSMQYKILRREVENVFSNTYGYTPSIQYEGISDMTFSNGSVIATSTALFGSKQINQFLVKNVFVSNYELHPSLMLDLNISYTADQEPTAATLPLEQESQTSTTHSVSTSTTVLTTATHTTMTSSSPPTHSSTHSVTHSSTHPSTHSSTHPSTHSSTPPSTQYSTHFSTQSTTNSSTHSSTHSSTQSTTNSSTHSSANSSTHASTITTNHSSTDPTSHTSRPPQEVTSTTLHRSTSLNNETHSTVHPTNNSSHHQNETVTATISTSVTVNPSNLTTASSSHSAANHSVSPGGNVSEKPSGPEVPGTAQVHHSTPSSTTTGSTAEQAVPGWGVALLVLAAIILFLLLLLFILLLLCWCCWWRRRGFMNVSDPDPPGYYNPDIPMYSTHSTFDSYNGKSPQDSDSEKPPKNRTGMYVVNK